MRERLNQKATGQVQRSPFAGRLAYSSHTKLKIDSELRVLYASVVTPSLSAANLEPHPVACDRYLFAGQRFSSAL